MLFTSTHLDDVLLQHVESLHSHGQVTVLNTGRQAKLTAQVVSPGVDLRELLRELAALAYRCKGKVAAATHMLHSEFLEALDQARGTGLLAAAIWLFREVSDAKLAHVV